MRVFGKCKSLSKAEIYQTLVIFFNCENPRNLKSDFLFPIAARSNDGTLAILRDIRRLDCEAKPATVENGWKVGRLVADGRECILSGADSLLMSQRGIWQLKKLVVSYCNWGGSSRGIRAFMEDHLPAFTERNPQLEVVTELNRGQHPLLKGFYQNKNERVVCVRNLSSDEVLQCATRLRNSLGRKVVKLKTRHVTKHPSVQGTWTSEMQI